MNYFPPPKVIETEIYTRLPEKFRKTDNQNRNSKRILNSFLEGPSFDRNGNLYVTDIPNGRVFRISSDCDWELIAQYNGEPNGLKIHKDGRIFIADHRNGIMLLDKNTGSVSPHLIGPEKERFKGVNDLIFASNGDLFFTDQGQTGLHDPTGLVYRYSIDGCLRKVINTIPSPNGIVLNRSEKTIIVAVTRANAVWLIPMTKNGGATKVGLFAQLPSPGPDGLAIDDAGNIAVAHPGLGIVWLYDRSGIPIFQVRSCAGKMVTNIAYGGQDNLFLYITEATTGCILRAEMPVPGRKMFSHL